jgi:hypothetical protein
MSETRAPYADDGDLITLASMDALQATLLRALRDDVVSIAARLAKLEGAEACDHAGVGLLRSQVDNLIERVGNLEDVIEAMGDED